MIENNLISIPCYEFQTSENIMEQVDKILPQIKFEKTENNQVSQTVSLDLPELTSWIYECLEQVQKKVFPNLTGKLKLTSVWLNRATKMQFHHKHSHSNSIVSGILYITDSNHGGDTVFYLKNPWYQIHNDGHILLDPNNDVHYELESSIKPKRGKLIIFPSTVKHKVTPLIDNSIRYTIAFNTFLDGNLGNYKNATVLNLKSFTNEGKEYL